MIIITAEFKFIQVKRIYYITLKSKNYTLLSYSNYYIELPWLPWLYTMLNINKVDK